jgi:hypothetical protein
MSTLTTEQQTKITDTLARMHLPSGLGDEHSACSIAAINLALTGTLTDHIPECMSEVIGYWIIGIQDAMPDELRNSARWKALLPLAAGTGRGHESERLDIILDWLWRVVLPDLQPQADAGGYGAAWRRMCEARAARAATAARATARATAEAAAWAWAAARAAKAAAKAAACAAWAVRATAEAAADADARATAWTAEAAARAATTATTATTARAAAAAATATATATATAAATATATAAAETAWAAAKAAAKAEAKAEAKVDAARATAAAAAWDRFGPCSVLERLINVGGRA